MRKKHKTKRENKMRVFSLIIILGIILSFLVYLNYNFSSKSKEENHVHTIAFDPSVKGVFYLGTHHGLIKIKDNVKVDEYGEDDFMGLIISKDGSFYSSGHSPKLGEVGVRKSVDKGKTWKIIAYNGLDFHDMTTTYSNKNIVYAWSTPPEELFVLSKDAGNSWKEINPDLKAIIFSLEADHQNENVVYAGTLFGISKSEDYGENWEKVLSLINVSVIAIADNPKKEGIMYISAHKKGLMKTTDNGKTWVDFNNGLPDHSSNIITLLAIDPFDSTKVYGITKNEEVYFYNGLKWEELRF